MPRPDGYFVERCTDRGGGFGTGAADDIVVDIAVLAPGAEHHITRPQVPRDELSQLKFALGQGVVGEPTANPLQAVHRQTEAAQGFDAFLGAKHAEAFLRPLL